MSANPGQEVGVGGGRFNHTSTPRAGNVKAERTSKSKRTTRRSGPVKTRIKAPKTLADEIDAAHSHRGTPSFEARYPGTCATCYREINVGDRVHYGPQGLVHHTHASRPPQVSICATCHLAKPCECEA